MHWNRKHTYIAFAIFALVYLAIHAFIFDRNVHFTGIWDFIAEGREHIVHVAPVIIIFVILVIKDWRDRKKQKTGEGTAIPHEETNTPSSL